MRINQIPFKIFGLQRSGTNLMQLLLLRNYEVRSLERGNEWKHGRIADTHKHWLDRGHAVRIIVCVKNPYAWLHSCYQYFLRSKRIDNSVDQAFQTDWSFEKFVKSASYEFETPVHRWNILNRHWVEFPGFQDFAATVRNEDLLGLGNQMRVLERLEVPMKLPRKGLQLRCAWRRVGVNMRLKDKFDSEYYSNERYLSAYSEALLVHVNAHLDWSLCKEFSYERRG